MDANQQMKVERGLCQDQETVERSGARASLPVTRSVERDDALELELELPGVRREDVELLHEGRRLTVRARAADRQVPEGMRTLHAELGEGVYEAHFALPRGIAADRIEASLQAGVLTLTLPRAQPERRAIPVRGA